MVFDAETKCVLHTEMAKKNLFVKRGEITLNASFVVLVIKYVNVGEEVIIDVYCLCF